MNLTESIAEFLRGNGFADATSGIMAAEPDRTAAVFATGVKNPHDEDGSRFQVLVRSEKGVDTALSDILDVCELLDGFSGILTADADAPYIIRIDLDSGAANLGEDENRRIIYSANFRAWYC